MKTTAKMGRITFDDYHFRRLIDGETIVLDVRPDTTKLQIKLAEDSKYRRTYLEILRQCKS